MTARTQNRPHPSPPPHGQVLPPADSHLPTPALPRMDRSHRQQTPLSPRPPSPAWTGLIASRLLSPYARPPPHGTGLTASRLLSPSQALPRMDRSHRQQTPSRSTPEGGSPRARPPPRGQVSSPADSSLPTPVLPRVDRSHRQQTPLSLPKQTPLSFAERGVVSYRLNTSCCWYGAIRSSAILMYSGSTS